MTNRNDERGTLNAERDGNAERETLNAEHQSDDRAPRLRSAFSVHRSAFSLTEVMFAVIVLGIGFIMIAAIFPVSISQTRLTVDETAAASYARAGLAVSTRAAEGGDNLPSNYPAGTAFSGLLPPTTFYSSSAAPPFTGTTETIQFDVPANSQVTVPGKVLSFYDDRLNNSAGVVTYRDNLWNAFKGNLIPPSDTRFAWVPLYKRDVTYFNTTGSALTVSTGSVPSGIIALPAPYAQVYFLPVAVRNRTNFQTDPTQPDYDLNAPNATLPLPGNLIPRHLVARIMPELTSTSGYVIAFDYLGANIASQYLPTDTVAENSFVVISDDRIATPINTPGATNLPVNHGRMNGRVFRVGVRRSDLDGVAPFFVNKNTNRDMFVWELAAGSDFSKDTGANGKFHNPAASPPDGDTDDIVAIGNGSTNPGNTMLISNAIRTALGWTAADFFSETTGPADVLVIGRTPIANTNPAQYEGLPQDISAYVTFIKVN